LCGGVGRAEYASARSWLSAAASVFLRAAPLRVELEKLTLQGLPKCFSAARARAATLSCRSRRAWPRGATDDDGFWHELERNGRAPTWPPSQGARPLKSPEFACKVWSSSSMPCEGSGRCAGGCADAGARVRERALGVRGASQSRLEVLRRDRALRLARRGLPRLTRAGRCSPAASAAALSCGGAAPELAAAAAAARAATTTEPALERGQARHESSMGRSGGRRASRTSSISSAMRGRSLRTTSSKPWEKP